MIENDLKPRLMLDGDLYYFLINGEVLSVRKDFSDASGSQAMSAKAIGAQVMRFFMV